MIIRPGIFRMHPGQKAVIASGFSESEQIRAAREAGVGQVVRKPYTLGTMGLAIRNELN